MDRLLSDEERIKRAEDLVERRKNSDLRISSESFSKEKSNNRIRKMLYQILICLIIYCSIFYIKNSNNQNLQFIVNNVNKALNYDVDFNKIYNFFSKKVEEFKTYIEEKSEDNTTTDDNVDENKAENNEESDDKQNEISSTEELGIGGAYEENEIKDSEIISEEEQMQLDANYIKSNYDLAKPIGTYIVTSEFGSREPNAIVSANHKGIDLGASVGTDIYSSLDGIVIEASDYGDYGTHLKIQTDDIVIIYAHCSKLFVKQGDKISKGEKIAEVGATGKATGPHLHFEVRAYSRAVNPRLIMEF
ncbi:MAG: M23 family metallopeptidase [Clostridia bacterium]|nr:M23 family metallopeptidase [Clostridia bacterium]